MADGSGASGTTEAVVLEPLVHDGAMEPRRKSILRFPPNLRRIAEDRDYVAPRTVALGPYYHGRPEHQEMEEVKNTAVGFFHELAAETPESAYRKMMVPIACQIRGWYADAAGIATDDDDEFATMMFVDWMLSAFLVQFINTMLRDGAEETAASPLRRMMQPHLLGIMRDMMLLENQIPWPVMEFFMRLKGLQMKDIIALLVSWGLDSKVSRDPRKALSEVHIDERCTPPSHLLSLIRFYKVGSSGGGGGKRNEEGGFSGKAIQISTSAAELAAMGIKLRASEKKTKLSDMNLMKHTLCAKLFLPPLYVDSLVANWLVNMAVFEMCTEASYTDEYSINSYLSVLSLLMNQENDVRELRVKHIVHGFFGDQEALDFFKSITPLLYLGGQAYLRIIGDLEAYRDNRRHWIRVYSFLYNQKKTIATVLSIAGVLVPIFKALFSLKKHQM